MDNRIGKVEMNVSGGRLRNNRLRPKRVVVTDLVTGGLRGMQPDNFLKPLAKLSAKVFYKGDKEKQKLSEIESNKGLNVADKVVKGVVGAAAALTGLKLGGIIGGSKQSPTAKSIDTSAFKPGPVKSVTPMISPLPMSVPKSPGDANIEAAIQESQRNPATSLPDAIVRAAEMIPEKERAGILERAQRIYDSGTNGVLSQAQKKLQDLTTGILPKTKPVKDAEALLTSPQHSGVKKASTETLGLPTNVLLPLVGVVILVLLFAMKKQG